MEVVVGHLCCQVIVSIDTPDRPVANVDVDALCGCAVGNLRIWLDEVTLVKVELASSDVADGEVCGIDGWQVTAQGLKEDQFKAVVVCDASWCYGVDVACVVPPFVQVVMCGFILWEAYGW